MMMDEWLEKGGYLPPFMRDFHVQKLLFKRIDEVVQRKRDEGGMLAKDLPDWISAHIYAVDFFLWFMARRGWTLQRSRKEFEFTDMQADLADFDKRMSDAAFAALKRSKGER